MALGGKKKKGKESRVEGVFIYLRKGGEARETESIDHDYNKPIDANLLINNHNTKTPTIIQ